MDNGNIVNIANLNDHVGRRVTLAGWLYNLRSSGKVLFLIVRDGTGLCQCVLEKSEENGQLFENIKRLGQESSLLVSGSARAEPRAVGGYELAADDARVLGESADYPITPKSHGIDFLMKHRHLWLRSQRPWAMARVRHVAIEAVRGFFDSRGFTLVDTPILSASVGEGASTLFEVDYFGSPTYLAQTGQLYLEAACMALGKVYSFGPTFRAEKSKTRRHLTEFWMIEPEVAFAELDEIIQLGEDVILATVSAVLDRCGPELAMLGRDITALEAVAAPFPRLSYSEAVEILHSNETQEKLRALLAAKQDQAKALAEKIETAEEQLRGSMKAWKRDKLAAEVIENREESNELNEQIANIPKHMELAANFTWGKDLGGSDESIISEHFDRPVAIHRYPVEAKAFYMKRDPDDGRVVLNFDMLAPEGFGEIIGGSQREDNLDALLERMKAESLDPEGYQWYLDLRRFGSVPHGGFGMGLERTIAWLTGTRHIRETIAFPRMMGRLYP